MAGTPNRKTSSRCSVARLLRKEPQLTDTIARHIMASFTSAESNIVKSKDAEITKLRELLLTHITIEIRGVDSIPEGNLSGGRAIELHTYLTKALKESGLLS